MSAKRTVIVANLGGRELTVGDVVTAVVVKSGRYGEFKIFTVERTEAAHAAEVERLAELDGLNE